MLKQGNEKKLFKKNLFRIKQETDLNKQPYFSCFDKTRWEGNSNYSQNHRGSEEKRQCNYAALSYQVACSVRTWQTWSQIFLLPSRTRTHSTFQRHTQEHIKVFG